MRVLLFSPLPGIDPHNGDVIYTASLLAHPPTGVEYVTYADALHSGEIVEHGRRSALRREDGLTAFARELVSILESKAVNVLRRIGLMFREPFRSIEVHGAFDLIHCHVFSVRWSGRHTPLVVSNAAPQTELYLRARQWGGLRVKLAERLDHALANRTGVIHISSDLNRAQGVVAFTQALSDWYQVRGTHRHLISVVPCSAGAIAHIQVPFVANRVGFVAGDFGTKGGAVLLEAWPEVMRNVPDASLVVVGSIARPSSLPDGVRWLGPVPRIELLNEVMPSFAVLAYPSNFDGLPLTLLEAQALGVPAVVSNYFALPEVVGPSCSAGTVVEMNNPRMLAKAIVNLLNPESREAASRAARHRYSSTYGPEAVASQLADAYERAIERDEASKQ